MAIFHTLTPNFSWANKFGATSYSIQVMLDNNTGTCHVDNTCKGVWERTACAFTSVTYNDDGRASPLIFGNRYRVRVNAYSPDQIDPIDTTLDVSFTVSN
jgi:hypothetical protein